MLYNVCKMRSRLVRSEKYNLKQYRYTIVLLHCFCQRIQTALQMIIVLLSVHVMVAPLDLIRNQYLPKLGLITMLLQQPIALPEAVT